MYHLADAYLLSALVAVLAAYLGALVFGAASVPSLVLRTVDDEAAAKVLRSFWPSYYRIAVVVGTLLTIAIAVVAPVDALPAIYALLLTALAGLMTLCFFVGMRQIKQINAAKDAGDTVRFNRLHRANMLSAGLGLLLGLTLLFAVIYVLPGQFTFWQYGEEMSTTHDHMHQPEAKTGLPQHQQTL